MTTLLPPEAGAGDVFPGAGDLLPLSENADRVNALGSSIDWRRDEPRDRVAGGGGGGGGGEGELGGGGAELGGGGGAKLGDTCPAARIEA